MRKRLKISLFLFVAAFLLSACVPSVNPLYTPETVVFRSELLGVWKEKAESEESWAFSKFEADSYKVIIQEKESSSEFIGKLVKLGDAHFLDLYPTDEPLEKNKAIGVMYKAAFLPCHMILKVELGEALKVNFMQPQGLRDILQVDANALSHTFREKDYPVITATTKDLQAFVRKHATSEQLWGEPGTLKKIQL